MRGNAPGLGRAGEDGVELAYGEKEGWEMTFFLGLQ